MRESQLNIQGINKETEKQTKLNEHLKKKKYQKSFLISNYFENEEGRVSH